MSEVGPGGLWTAGQHLLKNPTCLTDFRLPSVVWRVGAFAEPSLCLQPCVLLPAGPLTPGNHTHWLSGPVQHRENMPFETPARVCVCVCVPTSRWQALFLLGGAPCPCPLQVSPAAPLALGGSLHSLLCLRLHPTGRNPFSAFHIFVPLRNHSRFSIKTY